MPPLPQEEPPRLSHLTGECQDAGLEALFWQDTRQDWLKELRVVCWAGGAFYLGGFVVDVYTLGFSQAWPLAALLAIRVLVATTVGLMAWRVVERLSPGKAHVLVLAALFMYAGGTVAIVGLSPPDVMQHSISVMVIVLAMVLLVPAPLTYSAAAALAMSAGFLVVLAWKMTPSPGQTSLVLLDLSLVNLLSLLARGRLNQARRMQWANLRSEQKANKALRQEVTERARAERGARESEERFRRLVELSPDAVVVHRRGTLLYANQVARDLLSVPPDEPVEGQMLEEYVHPDERGDLAARSAALAQGLASKQPAVEVKLLDRQGQVIHGEVVSGVTSFGGAPAIQSIIRDIAERRRMEQELKRLAHHDPLTDAFNRRRFEELGQAELARARRYNRPLTVLMLDLDYFKEVNDRYGHAAGDLVLQQVATRCREALREQDLFGRLGGEEFGVVLPETGLDDARQAAERLRQAVEKARVPWEGEIISVTVSIGVARLTDEEQLLEQCLRRADRALYAAKGSGRDRVVEG